MTLQGLLDELSALPASARTATVSIQTGTDDLEILPVRYESGVAIITCEGNEPEDDDDA